MACKDGFSSGHEELRDLALAKLEEKRKELEQSRRQVEDEIQRFRNEIQRIQSEIQRSEGDLDRIDLSLKENRAEYGKIVNASSSLLNLPTEVTCMIFELSSSTHNLGKTVREEKSPMLPEVVISQVCTRWRDIALSCASLWTRFYFSLDKVKSTNISNTVTRFDTYLRRSGSRNLELFFNFRQCPRVKLSRKEQDQLLDMALKHINRWKIVTLLVQEDLDLDTRLPSLLTASAPELEYFVSSSLRIDYLSSKMFGNPSSFLQGGAPKLRHLQLNCSPLYKPPSANITTLHLELNPNSLCIPYSWETFLAILSLPLLANLSIVRNIFVARAHKPIVNMNNLKHLRYSDNEDMSHLLPVLRAPLLKTLVIHYGEDFHPQADAPQQLEDTQGLQKNSYFFPSLETLVFLESFPSSASFAGYIPCVTRNITSITACFYAETENFPWANERAVEWWPKLTSITLLNGPLCDAQELEAMRAFMLGRKKLNLRLSQALHFDLEYFFPAEHEAIQRKYSLELLAHEAEMVFLNQTWPPEFNSLEHAVIERETGRKDPFQMGKYM